MNTAGDITGERDTIRAEQNEEWYGEGYREVVLSSADSRVYSILK